MGLTDSYILGRISDIEDGDIPQEEVNEKSLIAYDQNELLKKISMRISKYELEFLIESSEKNDSNSFWFMILSRIIKTYSLNPLKALLNDEYPSFNQKLDIKDTLIFLKTILPDIVVQEKIDVDIDRSTLKKIMKERNAPATIHYSLKYSDSDSLTRFIKKIVKESKQEYNDE